MVLMDSAVLPLLGGAREGPELERVCSFLVYNAKILRNLPVSKLRASIAVKIC